MTSSPIAFASALSTRGNASEAVREVCDVVRSQLPVAANLGFVFFSPHHADSIQQIAAELAQLVTSPENLLGCTGEAIVGQDREIEEEPALSLWLASLPNSEITTMRLEFHRTPEGHAIGGWPDHLIGKWGEGAFLLALGESFSFPADVMLEQLNEDRPGTPVAGGMASGGHSPGINRLIRGTEVFTEGAVVAHISGGVRLRTVVSQGCRPIGKPFVVTKAERNVIYQLGGRPALEQLKDIFQTLPTREQQLVNSGLHLGRVVSEYQDRLATIISWFLIFPLLMAIVSLLPPRDSKRYISEKRPVSSRRGVPHVLSHPAAVLGVGRGSVTFGPGGATPVDAYVCGGNQCHGSR